MRSLSGLQLGNDVMFLKQQTYANPRHRLHVRNMFPQNPNDLCDDDEDDDVAVVSHAVSDPGLYNDPGQRSLFSRPGLGTLVFRRNYGSDGVQEDDSYSVEGQESSWREQNIHFREGICLRRPSLDQDTISNRLLKVQKHTNLQQREWRENINLPAETSCFYLTNKNRITRFTLTESFLIHFLSAFP